MKTLTAGEKAAKTRKERFENATPGKKAWITRRRREAARKAWETRRSNGN
jgi:hypothetical protein